MKKEQTLTLVWEHHHAIQPNVHEAEKSEFFDCHKCICYKCRSLLLNGWNGALAKLSGCYLGLRWVSSAYFSYSMEYQHWNMRHFHRYVLRCAKTNFYTIYSQYLEDAPRIRPNILRYWFCIINCKGYAYCLQVLYVALSFVLSSGRN